MDNYKITQYAVNNILNLVEANQIAIPEMQRPFVWKGEEVKDLIDSLYEGYPIGYLIIWQNTQARLRDFAKAGTRKILIDGQQRVTALMAALLGKEILDNQYQSHRICIGFNPLPSEGEEHFAVTNDIIANDPKWIPDISVIFKKNFSYRQFEQEYKEKNPKLDHSGLEEAIDTLRDIVKHQVGVIELSFLLDIDVVSEIFIRINLQGKPLNQEDFAMSKISVNEQYDGDHIRNTIDYFCHLLKEPEFFGILESKEQDYLATGYGKEIRWAGKEMDTLYKPTYADVLKVVTITEFGKSRIGDLVNRLSGKDGKKAEVSKKVARASFKALGKGVKAFVNKDNFLGFTGALKKAGYGFERLLYSQSLLNYSYAMYLLMAKEGIKGDKRDSLLGKWITMAMLSGHYQGSPDSVVVRDYDNIAAEGFESYLSQIEQLRMTDVFFETLLPDRFRTTAPRTAPFLVYMAALNHTGASSLYSEEKIGDLYQNKAEGYQILPKSYLQKSGFMTREIYGQVANLTYVSKDVKAILRKRAPAAYKEDLFEKVDESVISASLKDNALDDTIFSLDGSQAETFFDQRRKDMAAQVKAYYEAL